MRRSFRVLLVLALFALTAGQLMAQIVTNGDMTQNDPAERSNNPCLTQPLGDLGGLGGTPIGADANPIGWSDVFGTADYYLQCGNTVPVTADGDLPDARADELGAFIGLWVANNYREYIQNTLARRLVRGRRYRLSGRVAVREPDWINNQLGLSSPRHMTIIVAQDDQVQRDGNGAVVRRDGTNVPAMRPVGSSLAIVIEDQAGHGNVGQVGANRWQWFTGDFTVPQNWAQDAGFLLISPGPNRAIQDGDVVPLADSVAAGNRSYVYVDGLRITPIEDVCACNNITVTIRQVAGSIRGNGNECCFVVDVENPLQLPIDRSGLSLSFSNSGGPERPLESIPLSGVDWSSGRFTSPPVCISRGSRQPIVIKASVTLCPSVDLSIGGASAGSNQVCTTSAELFCDCNCEGVKPTIRFERVGPPPTADDERCCYEAFVDMAACSGLELRKVSVASGNDQYITSSHAVDFSRAYDRGVYVGQFCRYLDEMTPVNTKVTVSINGEECPPIELEPTVLFCDDPQSECCSSYTILPVSLADARLHPNTPSCRLDCPPIALRLQTLGTKGLCAAMGKLPSFKIITDGNVYQQITLPVGTRTAILDIVCPGDQPRVITVIQEDPLPGCRKDIVIPACRPRDGDDGGGPRGDEPWDGGPDIPGSLGKQSGGTPHHDHDHGDAGPFTMSVNDLRGVQYGTFTGTDVKALMEQAKESSTMPTGLYVALIRNAAGQLVEWKTFVK